MRMPDLSRRDFVCRLMASGTLSFVVGCRTGEGGAGEGSFRFDVLNPDFMVGGAGQCVVMRTPGGKTYLYDTANGDFMGEKRKNNGKDIVVPWLNAHGIEKIDGLVISHYHADHFGGLLWMWDHFPIEKIYNNNYTPDFTGLTEHDVMEYKIARKCLDDWGRTHPGCLVENTKAGDDLGWNEPDVTFDVVWPPREGYVKPLANRKDYTAGDNHFHHLLNGNSTALRITAGGRVFFILGDIQPDYARTYMRPLMERQGTWGCDIAVLPSHGTVPHEMVKDVNAMQPRPKTVIASLGNQKWMLEVGRSVKRIYGAAGYEAYATSLDGDVSCDRRGEVSTDETRTYPHDPK